VPNTPLDVYLYAKQDKPTVIHVDMTGGPCDIEVESCAIWGVPAGDDFALGMGLTLTTTDSASKLYAEINFEKYRWKMLSGSTIYLVYGSGTAAETLKRAIANNDFKYYDDTESLKAVVDLPNSGIISPTAIAIVKPSKALIDFIAKYVDPRYFDQVNTMLEQVNLKLIVAGLYSSSHIDIAKIVEVLEGRGSISNLNLGLLMLAESNYPGLLVEPAVKKFLTDYGFTEMGFAESTIYRASLDRYIGEAIPALVWINGNRVFAAVAGQESYAQSLISTTMAQTLLSPSQPLSHSIPQYQALTIDMLANFQHPNDFYSFPIYLKDNQRLHLTFSVTQGEPAFFFVIPSGKNIRLNTSGKLVETNLHDGEFIQLGNVIFKPSDYGWGQGYYEMTFAISDIGQNKNGENKAQVKVEYWIED
jgi:hypothetical protein